MLHLPIFENRIAQFAAKFAPLPDGNWVFHRNDWEEGWLIGKDELPDLLERHAAIVLRARTVSRWWIGIALVLIAAPAALAQTTLTGVVTNAATLTKVSSVFKCSGVST